ncbi:MAG: F0F1 ATP synthase subunit beta, partial [Mycobacteriaceae bacterium]|nr:F0F1 ATP synthase subunit beta [Mycobacteriaceae bacterium]
MAATTQSAQKSKKSKDTDTNGRVVRVAGPVVDVEFPRGSVPELFNALHAKVTFE